jgi:hypothetical protein
MADLNVNKSDTCVPHEDSGQNYIVNADFENAPSFTAAQTAPNWIDGTAAGSSTNSQYRWYGTKRQGTATFAIQYDNTVSHSGTYSIKIGVTASTSGEVTVRQSSLGGTGWSQNAFLIPVYASTSYTISGWMKTDSVGSTGTNNARFNIQLLNSSYAFSNSHDVAKGVTGTNDWTQYSTTFSTSSTQVYADILLELLDNTGTVWFDDISLTVNDHTLAGNVLSILGPVVTPGVQNLSGPKIWS